MWFAFHGDDFRGGQLKRDADILTVAPFGMRSFDFSIATGQIVDWHLNLRYFAYMAMVYSVPAWIIARWVRRLTLANRLPLASSGERRSISYSPGIGTILVVSNLALFASGVYMDSFGGAIDRLGGQICTLTYQIAFVLVPTTICISFLGLSSQPRRFDIFGPWLSLLSAMSMMALFNY